MFTAYARAFFDPIENNINFFFKKFSVKKWNFQTQKDFLKAGICISGMQIVEIGRTNEVTTRYFIILSNTLNKYYDNWTCLIIRNQTKNREWRIVYVKDKLGFVRNRFWQISYCHCCGSPVSKESLKKYIKSKLKHTSVYPTCNVQNCAQNKSHKWRNGRKRNIDKAFANAEKLKKKIKILLKRRRANSDEA